MGAAAQIGHCAVLRPLQHLAYAYGIANYIQVRVREGRCSKIGIAYYMLVRTPEAGLRGWAEGECSRAS